MKRSAKINELWSSDPLSLIINADLGSTFMMARQYDQAIAQLQRTLDFG